MSSSDDRNSWNLIQCTRRHCSQHADLRDATRVLNLKKNFFFKLGTSIIHLLRKLVGGNFSRCWWRGNASSIGAGGPQLLRLLSACMYKQQTCGLNFHCANVLTSSSSPLSPHVTNNRTWALIVLWFSHGLNWLPKKKKIPKSTLSKLRKVSFS